MKEGSSFTVIIGIVAVLVLVVFGLVLTSQPEQQPDVSEEIEIAKPSEDMHPIDEIISQMPDQTDEFEDVDILAGDAGLDDDADLDDEAELAVDDEDLDEAEELAAIDPAHILTCKNNLRRLAAASILHTLHSESKAYPASMKALQESGLISDGSLFVCPAAPAETKDWHTSYKAAFELTERPISNIEMPGDALMIWSSKPVQGKRIAALFNGKIVELDKAAFEAALENLKTVLE